MHEHTKSVIQTTLPQLDVLSIHHHQSTNNQLNQQSKYTNSTIQHTNEDNQPINMPNDKISTNQHTD